MTIIGRLRRRASSDDGLSLIELLVTMMITGVLLAIVGTMFVNVARITTNSNATTSRNGVAANVMNEVTKVVRMAANNPVSTSVDADPAVISATPTALTVYSFVDTNPTLPAPTKVGFRFDAQGNLIEDRWAGTRSGNYWVFTGSVATRTIGGPMQNLTGTDAFFVYLNGAGVVVTNGTSALTLAQRATVASIQVTVRLTNAQVSGTDPIVIINTVGMPNLQLSRTDN